MEVAAPFKDTGMKKVKPVKTTLKLSAKDIEMDQPLNVLYLKTQMMNQQITILVNNHLTLISIMIMELV